MSIYSNDILRSTCGMGSVPPLLTFLLTVVSGWIHRHQLIVIEFLQTENRLLKDRLRGRGLLWSAINRAAGTLVSDARKRGPSLA